MPASYQIILPDAEKERLIRRIESDCEQAAGASIAFAERCRGWMQKWENRVNPAKAGDETKPNHTVPLVQWQTFNKLARDLQSLLGDDAAISARAVGPSDAAKAHKIGRYMTSRVFDQMKIINPLAVFAFRRVLFGHSVAYRPWWKREFNIKEKGRIKRVCDYQGPGFFPCEPDDILTPPERGVTSIHDFSFVLRRRRVTVDELQRGDGYEFQGTSKQEFVERAIRWARENSNWDDLSKDHNQVREERERSEGVDYDTVLDSSRSLWLWEWYGYWRPLKKAKKNADADEVDLTQRDAYEADWVVRYLPGMKEIVGCQDLLDIYPKMRRRRPFVESTLIKDGTYRPKGFGALLEDLEDDATSNSRLFASAGELSVWPVVFYKPGAGMDAKVLKIEPGMAYPTEDPNGVRVVTINPNLQFGAVRQTEIITHSERVTGITDQSMGRALTQPNAPRTASGQIALIEQGNIRAWMDATVLRTDMEEIISDFWDLDCDLLPKSDAGLFFRVTEEQAKGLFDTQQGGAYMTPQEFGGTYDFSLKFATSIWARQAQKQEFLAFYQVAAASPLIATNPLAQWTLLNRLAQQFGVEDFMSIVPRPPELDMPQAPEQEWTRMLEGEEVPINPQDHDEIHLAEHQKQIDLERKNPSKDEQAIALGIKHLLLHKEQIQQKKLMQALVSNIVEQVQNDPMNPVSQQIQQHMMAIDQQQQPQADPQMAGMPAPPAGMPQQGMPQQPQL